MNPGRNGSYYRTNYASIELSELFRKKLRGRKVRDLDELISFNEEKIFITNIFDDENDAYLKFVKLINKIPSWELASPLIEKRYMKIGIDPYSKEALRFSNLVYFRYFENDSAFPIIEEPNTRLFHQLLQKYKAIIINKSPFFLSYEDLHSFSKKNLTSLKEKLKIINWKVRKNTKKSAFVFRNFVANTISNLVIIYTIQRDAFNNR